MTDTELKTRERWIALKCHRCGRLSDGPDREACECEAPEYRTVQVEAFGRIRELEKILGEALEYVGGGTVPTRAMQGRWKAALYEVCPTCGSDDPRRLGDRHQADVGGCPDVFHGNMPGNPAEGFPARPGLEKPV